MCATHLRTFPDVQLTTEEQEDFFKPPVFGVVTHVPGTKHMLVPVN